ncbi:MAG: undecaprenyl-diphosphate phosphatase [Phycisphaerales bacterium]|nr:undecaprenyl-diphosphate phosphatase [Phycisphaerales bacterium]
MNELTYLQGIVLGVLQGLTEFLPVSSSGHLALVQRLMDLDPDTNAMIVFDLAVHLGTLVAVTAVFFSQVRRFASGLAGDVTSKPRRRPAALHIALLGVVACVPTGIIGVGLKDTLEAAFDKPQWIAAGLLFTGSLLWITGKLPRTRRGWRRMGWWRAIIVGTGQGIAITPGVSRSGTTISLALMLGMKRKWAGEFSFLMAFPAICGAAALKAKDVLESGTDQLSTLINGPLIVGTLVATVTGYVALRLLLVAVHRAKLHYFCYYCWALAVVVFFTLR